VEKKVLALIPLDLDGFLFGADYQSGKKAEITSRVAAKFVGWEKDHALFDREPEKVIRALRTDEAVARNHRRQNCKRQGNQTRGEPVGPTASTIGSNRRILKLAEDARESG
jgi:hypothetical protein